MLDLMLTCGSHMLLAGVYRRPNGHTLHEFFNTFMKYSTNFTNVIIAGDLNCNLLDNTWTANHLKTFIYESSLYCILYNTTHHSGHGDSWLDVILVDNISKLGTFHKSTSPFIVGHDYLYCEYHLNCPKLLDKFITFRNYKNCDHGALANALVIALKLDDIIIKNSDPNKLLDLFLSRVLEILNKYAPEITIKVTGNSNSWITKELKYKCHERDSLYKRAKRTKNQDLLALYKDMRKKLKLELNNARESYLKSQLTTVSPGKTIWNKLKRLGLIKTKQTSPLNYFDASLLNEHYANIVRKHPPCDIHFVNSLSSLYHKKVECSFKWHQIDIVDVTKALHLTLQKTKGKSPDGLNLSWLRDHIPQISLFLTSLFNRSLESGIFPDIWKMVFIIPLSKVSPPKSPSDTRPIANLSHLSKVFERIIANQVVEYLEENNLLDKYQSGFRKFHSIQSALLKLTEDIRCAIDRGELTLLVLFDFSKAFDYVNPKVILVALFELGFSIETVTWFLSYLSNRSQSILNDQNHPLEFLDITSGVPQGSVLGPILFLIVINLVVRQITHCKYGLFADDKYIYYHFKPTSVIEAIRLVTIDV
ncbi:GSCOCG00011342001-RA-CDS [Cotesia congregata]|nr:GSCOCG00011342001-RA-CDS [Cotesia congregata]